MISTFNNHVSIKTVRKFFPEFVSNDFEFTAVTEEDIKKEVLKLNTKNLKKWFYFSNSFEAVCRKLSDLFEKCNNFGYI